jgi:pyruvate/2-oxoglutarate dehydrogenase complex dihydrolipoamide dehydrogenase (E3) component
LSGYASFVDKNTVKIQNGDNVSHVQAKKILVAVGKMRQLFHVYSMFRMLSLTPTNAYLI